jgi:hypothetical protein
MIVATTSNHHQPDFCFGLVMLLEAAEHYNKNMATPPIHHTKSRGGGIVITSSLSPTRSSSKIVYSPSPPKKRFMKRYSPLGVAKLSPVKRSSNLIYVGSGSSSPCSAWKRLDFGSSTLCLNSITVTNEPKLQEAEAEIKPVVPVPVLASRDNANAIVLYNTEDDQHINAIHNIVRRDIWEGFVVDASDATALMCRDDVAAAADGGCSSDARRTGRLARYDGTVGFRCRFCKNEPPSQRAERSAVYPRSLERIYHANIRFQRDHIE